MYDRIFILLIGHGGSNIDNVAEFLNMSPDINMANGENLMILQEDNPKIYAPESVFSFDSELAQRTISEDYNGNKIILSSYFISAERIIGCINREKVIMHGAYSQLKILLINEPKNRIIETELFPIWERNEAELNELKNYYSGMAFPFSFDDITSEDSVRKKISDYLGIGIKFPELVGPEKARAVEDKPEKKPKKKSKPKAKPKAKPRPRRKKRSISKSANTKVGLFEKT